ncbi:MAG: transglutaminase-like domain-containing protein [Prevotella sp.]|nr:transglutaminase-like domain-containing protein [Prevotella sp.]
MNAERRSSAEVTASIHADKKRGGTKLAAAAGFAPIAIKILITACGCSGAAAAFLTCADPGINLTAAVLFPVLLCVVFTFIFSFKKKLYCAASLILASVSLILVYVFRYEICAGFAGTANRFMYVIREEYRSKPFIEISDPENSHTHINIFAGFFEYFMCGFACHAAARWNSASGVCLSTCVPFFSVLMFGLEPNPAAFFAVVVCWAAMFALEANAAESISDPRCKKYSSQCGFYTAVISALCIAAVIGVSEKLDYKRPEKLNIMYDEAVDYFSGGGMRRTIDNIAAIVTRNIAPTGAINHGRLGEFDEISFDGVTVLEVTVPKSDETVYLRGFVGSVYTGRSWEQLPAAKLRELDVITEAFATEGLSPLLLDGYNLKYTRAEMPQYSFSVKNIAANTDYLYMPYNLVPESVSRYRINAGSGFGGAGRSYIGQFYDPKNYYGYQNIFRKKWSTPNALSEDEAAYRSFVYENYLEIPDSFSPNGIFDESYYQYITAETVKTGKSTLDDMTVLSRKIYFIKKWLRDNCEYSLSAGKLPAGKDFAEHFLENRKGSCSHFATAAAIMCRYAGIPARYAEGYIIKPKDFPSDAALGASVTVNVTDLRGHAWVEIYLDGFGWYPVEFTSGYGNIRTAVPTETAVSETETETLSETERVSETAENYGETETVPGGGSEQSAGNSENSLPPENSAQQETSAETQVPEQSAESVPPAETGEYAADKPSVGFSVFGMKGEEKVDVLYDLTWLVVLAAAAVLLPAAFAVRRNAAVARRRRLAVRGAKAAALDDYKRFARIVKLMGMPEQGGMSFDEYAKSLSERSEMLGDGTAELIIGCALKASFGGESLTRSEANEMRLAVNSLAKRYCAKLTHFGKFKVKFVYCLL